MIYLNQIENNKANSSMETLITLANKLDIPVSELLSDKQSFDVKTLLKTIKANRSLGYEGDLEVGERIRSQIEECINDLTFQSYEEVRLIVEWQQF